MKCAIDGYSLSYTYSMGLKTYASSLIAALSSLQKNNSTEEIDVFVPSEDLLIAPIHREGYIKEFASLPGLNVAVVRFPLIWKIFIRLLRLVHSVFPGGIDDVYKIHLYIWLKYILPVQLKKTSYDSVLYLSQFVVHPGVTAKTIAVVHDVMTWYGFRGGKRQNSVREYIYSKFLAEIRKFDLLVSVSHATKADLIVEFGFDPAKIEVIYESVFRSYHTFLHQRLHEKTHEEIDAKVQQLARTYHIEKPYVLVTNPFNERKNAAAIISAIDICRNSGHQIVFIGSAKRKRQQTIKGNIMKIEGAVDVIRFIDISDHDDLPYLYHGARVFCSFSLKEGFGLPPLEALASGTQVIVSCYSTHLELLRNFSVNFVDPFNKEEVQDVLKNILEHSDSKRKEIIRSNDVLIEKFLLENSWNTITKRLIRVMRSD